MLHIRTLYIAKGKNGRAVYTGEDLLKGDIIEVCPMIILPASEEKIIRKTKLHDYYFILPNQDIAMVLGYGSLYNHSSTPNAQLIINPEEEEMIFEAIQPIKAGTEITFDYTGGIEGMKIWFKEK